MSRHLFHQIQELKLGVTAIELEAISGKVEKVERALVKAEQERDEARGTIESVKALVERWRERPPRKRLMRETLGAVADELEAALD